MARYPEHTSSVNSFHPRGSRYSLECMLEMLSLAIMYRLVLDLLWRCSRSPQWLEENLTFGDLEGESTWAVVGDRDYPGAGGWEAGHGESCHHVIVGSSAGPLWSRILTGTQEGSQSTGSAF